MSGLKFDIGNNLKHINSDMKQYSYIVLRVRFNSYLLLRKDKLNNNIVKEFEHDHDYTEENYKLGIKEVLKKL